MVLGSAHGLFIQIEALCPRAAPLASELPPVHWVGQGLLVVPRLTVPLPTALCAGAALLEVGAAATAHSSVLLGGLRPLCGLYSCV